MQIIRLYGKLLNAPSFRQSIWRSYGGLTEWLRSSPGKRVGCNSLVGSSPMSSANKTVEISMVFFLFCDVGVIFGVNYFFCGAFLASNAFSYKFLTGPFAISGTPESPVLSKISCKNSSGMTPSTKI